MIPLRDLNPASTRPVLIYALIAINVLVFLGTAMDLNDAARSLGAVAAHYTGGIEPSLIQTVREPLADGRFVEIQVGPEGYPLIPRESSWWTRTLTHMFVHGGIMHIAGNMLFLWVFGDNVEDRFGRGWFLLAYFGAGLVALGTQIVSEPGSGIPMVGASGAVAGVLGAYLKLFPRAKVVGLVPLGFFFFIVTWSAAVFLGLWIGMQFLNVAAGGGGGVAWWAHIGGFGFGYVLAAILMATGRVTAPMQFASAPSRGGRGGGFGSGFGRGRIRSVGQRPSEGPFGTYGGTGRGKQKKITLRDLFRRY